MSLSTSWRGGKITATLKKSFIVIATCRMYNKIFVKKSVLRLWVPIQPCTFGIALELHVAEYMKHYTFFFFIKENSRSHQLDSRPPTPPSLSYLIYSYSPRIYGCINCEMQVSDLLSPRPHKCTKGNTSGVLIKITSMPFGHPGSTSPDWIGVPSQSWTWTLLTRVTVWRLRPEPSSWHPWKCSFLLLVCVPACLEMQKVQGWIRTRDPTSHWHPKALCSCHWAMKVHSFFPLLAPEEACLKHFYWSMPPFSIWTLNQHEHWHLKAKELACASTCWFMCLQACRV